MSEIGITGLTVTEVKGFGTPEGAIQSYIVALNMWWIFLPKIKLELIVAENLVDASMEAIIKAARTGKIGDGKIFVSSIEQVVRIRTGETGEEAFNLFAWNTDFCQLSLKTVFIADHFKCVL